MPTHCYTCLSRFVVTIFPQAHSSVLEEEISDMDDLLMQNDSLNGACQFVKPPPSPFSSRKAMYENEEVILHSCSAHTNACLVWCCGLVRQPNGIVELLTNQLLKGTFRLKYNFDHQKLSQKRKSQNFDKFYDYDIVTADRLAATTRWRHDCIHCKSCSYAASLPFLSRRSTHLIQSQITTGKEGITRTPQ